MANCCIKDCKNKVSRRGLCVAHYARLLNGKSLDEPLQMQHHGLSTKDRFDRWWKEDEKTGCWIWQGKLQKTGYGQFNLTGSRPIPSHRAAWLLYKGEIPENPNSAYKTYYLCHKCDNPACVNPDHLFLGDQQSNMDDKMGKDRHNYGISRGVNHGNAKVTDEDVRAIRASSDSLTVLSRRYGMAKSTLAAIRKRETWKHVE